MQSYQVVWYVKQPLLATERYRHVEGPRVSQHQAERSTRERVIVQRVIFLYLA